MSKISFIIPCYGSEKTIESVVTEIKETVAKNKKYTYEIIAVNDCSPDGVWDVLKKIASSDKRIIALNLAKNMNRPGALMAGLSRCSGDYVVLMDDDGQCPMNRLWDLVKELESGHDVAIAKYSEYKQKKIKSIGTFLNRKMSEIIIDKPKDLAFTNFTVIKKYIADEILKYKNPFPYMTGLILRTTRDIVNVEMEERTRLSGQSNFTFKKMFSLWINGFTAFSIKPLRISIVLGCIATICGLFYGLALICMACLGLEVFDYSFLIPILLFIGGVIMLMLGIIGEYVGRIYISINNSPQYVIKEAINFSRNKNDEII